jgi:hypothetical protein
MLTTTAAPWLRAWRINATCPSCNAPIVGTSATRRPARFTVADAACISLTVRMISMAGNNTVRRQSRHGQNRQCNWCL